MINKKSERKATTVKSKAVCKKLNRASTALLATSSTTKESHSTPNATEIIPQKPQKTLKPNDVEGCTVVQCWAHTKSGVRCTAHVKTREGEPIPVPYCKVHMKSGDGALKVVHHPIAGKCLVAR